MELYAHQKIALAYLRINDSFALFMEQGTGKTIPTLLRILELLSSGAIKNALIVAPKAALGAWSRDLEKLSKSGMVHVDTSPIEIVNYDLVWRREHYLDTQWDLIVLDESHSIKSHKTKRTKALLTMSTKAKYRYILSATPVTNGQLENLWSQFAFLNPVKDKRSIKSVIFDATYYQFLDKYCYLNKYYQPYSYKHVDEFQALVNEYSYRVYKRDCLDLPEKLDDEVIEVDNANTQMYKSLAKNSVIEKFDYIADNPAVKLTKLRQIASGFFIDDNHVVHELKNNKLPILKEVIESLVGKVVIFCSFKHSIQKVSETIKEYGEYVILDGDQKDKEIWKLFQSDPNIRFIICQYQSANAGIDLFAANTIIYYEPTLSSTILEQSKDRIHRIGQHDPCSYIHLITKGTVERAIFKALQGYMDFNEQFFNEYLDEYTRGYGYR